MSQFDKLMQSLRAEKTPPEASRDDIEKVLKHYGLEYEMNGGSHMVVTVPKLKGIPPLNQNGELCVPIKSGRFVKSFYIKSVLQLIDLLESEK